MLFSNLSTKISSTSLKSLCYFVDLAYSVEADLKSKNRDIDLLLELLISKMSLGGE